MRYRGRPLLPTEHVFAYALVMANKDLGYRLEVTMRSLASTRQTDGSLTLDSADARDLLELLEGSARAIREFGDLRRRLLEVINDPSHRSVTVPLRQVAALLHLDRR
jgi:hypothetical protein